MAGGKGRAERSASQDGLLGKPTTLWVVRQPKHIFITSRLAGKWTFSKLHLAVLRSTRHGKDDAGPQTPREAAGGPFRAFKQLTWMSLRCRKRVMGASTSLAPQLKMTRDIYSSKASILKRCEIRPAAASAFGVAHPRADKQRVGFDVVRVGPGLVKAGAFAPSEARSKEEPNAPPWLG